MGILRRDPRETFGKRMMSAIRACGYRGDITLADDEYALRGEFGLVALESYFRRIGDLPRDEQHESMLRIAREITGQGSSALGFDDVRGLLRPAVRSRVGTVELARLAGDDQVLARPLSERMTVGVVIDSEDTMVRVSGEMAGRWGTTLDEMLVIALANLRRVTPPDAFRQAQPGVWVSAVEDDYDASRMLLTDALRALPLRGRPVAFAPNRNLLVVAGEDDAMGLAEAVAICSTGLGDAGEVSGAPVVLGDAGWSDLRLPAGHAAAESLERLLRFDRAIEYDTTRQALQHAAGDVHVAAYMLADRPPDLFSLTVWTRGVAALLPVADAVALADGDATTHVWWRDAEDVAGSLLHPHDAYPRRVRVDAFPDATMLAELAGRAFAP